MLRFLSWLLLCCILLTACQAPIINNPLTAVPTSAVADRFPVPFADWQYWPAPPIFHIDDVAYGDGVVWVGTTQGAVRLDPRTHAYTVFEQLGTVSRLLPIENGQVFAISRQDGVYFFDGQVWNPVVISTTYQNGLTYIHALGLAANGDLWLQGSLGRSEVAYHLTGHIPPHTGPWVATYLDGQSSDISLILNDPINCDNWPAFAGWYTYRSPEECRRYALARKVLKQHRLYGPFALDATGVIWLETQDQLLRLAADGSTLSSWPMSESWRFAVDPQQGVWIASHSGLFFATESSWQQISLRLKDYPLYPPTSVAVDATGMVWAATSQGLYRLAADSREWQLFTDTNPNSPLNGSALRYLKITSDGQLWATHDNDLLRYDGQSFVAMPPFQSKDYACPVGPFQNDRAGNLWITGYPCGVLQFNPKTNQWQSYLADKFISQVVVDADDTIFAVTSDGVLFSHTSDPTHWQLYAQLDSDAQIVADNHGGIWVGGPRSADVLHYSGPGLAQPETLTPRMSVFYTLFTDRQSHLWASTKEQLMRYDGQTWQTVKAPPIGFVNSQVTGPDGRLWFAGDRGIAVYDPKLDKQP